MNVESYFNLLALAPTWIALVTPGYVWGFVYHRLVPRGNASQFSQTVACVLRASVSVLLALALLSAMFGLGIHSFIGVVELVVTTLVISWMIAAVLGFGFGVAEQKKLFWSLARKFEVSTLNESPTAWDRAFDQPGGCWVRITFKDGQNRWGIYGENSQASCGVDGTDIYLQEAIFSSEDELVPEPGTRGIWVNASEVICIRFYQAGGIEDGVLRIKQSQQGERTTEPAASTLAAQRIESLCEASKRRIGDNGACERTQSVAGPAAAS